VHIITGAGNEKNGQGSGKEGDTIWELCGRGVSFGYLAFVRAGRAFALSNIAWSACKCTGVGVSWVVHIPKVV